MTFSGEDEDGMDGDVLERDGAAHFSWRDDMGQVAEQEREGGNKMKH